jgi:hypothetical protein
MAVYFYDAHKLCSIFALFLSLADFHHVCLENTAAVSFAALSFQQLSAPHSFGMPAGGARRENGIIINSPNCARAEGKGF